MKTHSTSSARFLQLGALVSQARIEADIHTQAELAKLMDTTQQAVSRWESGASRPTAKQVGKLTSILRIEASELLDAAGYAVPAVIASFDRTLPLEGLTPDSFERFMLYFLAKQYPEADVHRYGETGHKQDGLDLRVIFPDGRKWTFQCKRVEQFGPQNVHTAVADYTEVADRKFLVLSRVASPGARKALDKHAHWELWDREDISRRVRELSFDDQRHLVRAFFRGMESALLGVDASLPWESTEGFFAAFLNGAAFFNHAWELVGRDTDMLALGAALNDVKMRVTFLTGPGGAGKSRILKKAVDDFQAGHKGVVIRFLARDSEITKKGLEDLGPKPKLLIVDDAHDRSDLGALFEHVAVEQGNTKLLVALRPYGLDFLRKQAANFPLAAEQVCTVELKPLSLDDAEALASQVLSKRGGPTDAARAIAKLTLDCPLATVLGAHIVATENVHPQVVQNESHFRETLIGRFSDVIVGQIGDARDAEPIGKLVRFIALVQPFHIDDERLLKAFEAVDGVAVHESRRLLSLLMKFGVLFKRGSRYRLSPDILGDYLIEAQCVGPTGASTGYAEKVLEQLDHGHLGGLLLNLARLDWRRTNYDPSSSPLLDGVWGTLKPSQTYIDPHIRAVQDVAYYQPGRALDFVEALIKKGQFLDQLADIAKYAAYNTDHVRRAVECLWELGRNDARDLGGNPNQPVRILTELVSVQPNKPYEINEIAVEYGLELASRPEAWSHLHTPLEFLGGILETEGHQTASQGHHISFSPFFVDPVGVAPLRSKVITFLMGLLFDADVRKAVAAAKKLSSAVRLPSGLLGASADDEIVTGWELLVAETMEGMLKAMQSTDLSPIVQIELARSVAWHAAYGSGQLSSLAAEIVSSMPQGLELRTIKGLTDGYGIGQRLGTGEQDEERWPAFMATLVTDLLAAYPEAAELHAYLDRLITDIEHAYGARADTAGELIDRLIKASPDFARSIVKSSQQAEPNVLSRFSGWALGHVFRNDRAEGRTFIRELLETASFDHQAVVAKAYQSQQFDGDWYDAEDRAVLGLLAVSEHETIVAAMIHCIRAIAEADQAEALSLARVIPVRTNGLAGQLAAVFGPWGGIPFAMLERSDAVDLLDRMKTLPILNGHSVDTLMAQMSERFPWETAAFYMARVDARANGADIRPVDHHPTAKLSFRQTPECQEILQNFVRWMTERDGETWEFSHYSRELFVTMFAPFDDEIVAFLVRWLNIAGESDVLKIAGLIRNAGRGFVFGQLPFVVAMLDKAKQFGTETQDRVASSLYSSAVSGMRSGTSGQPFPQDLELKDRAQAALASLPRFSSAYDLLQRIKKHAENDIARAHREAEDFDE